MLLETPVCDFGWKAPDFVLPDADGNSYQLKDLYGEKGVLLIFMCNHCPYVKAIIDRLVEDAEVIKAEGINVVAINANDYESYPDDSPEKMKEFVAQHGIKFPYLIDESQEIARAYGAVCTPDFFGFNAKGELQYRGRIDDAKMDAPEGRDPELLQAMHVIARTGRGPETQYPSMGCSIKWR